MPKGQHKVVAAAIRQAFTQPDQKGAQEVWRPVADQLRPRWPKLAVLMDGSEADVLAYMAFPAQHRTKLHSTNPLERLNTEVKRRADVVGLFPNEESIIRLIGAVLFEQNDDWQSQHRYMQLEAFAPIDAAQVDPLLSISTQALTDDLERPSRKLNQIDGRDPSFLAHGDDSGPYSLNALFRARKSCLPPPKDADRNI